MHTTRSIFPLTAIIASSLMSCASVTAPESPKTNSSNSEISTKPDSPIMVSDRSNPQSETILKEIISRQTNLQICDFEFDAEAALESSQVYTNDQDQHLVQLLCFMAAYQGAYTFLQVDTSQPELKIKPLELELAGFPEFDPQTKILSNAYKLTGAGTCIEETQYYWNGEQLKLISSELVDQVPDGCDQLGARSPSENQLITNKSVGTAKLGMTLGQLKQDLGEGATFEPTPLGVDGGEGIKVSQYGNVQYLLGFAKTPITNNSQITMITVENPNYRTTAGVGVGTQLKEAIAAYGQATLAYNVNNESREYIKFTRGLGADTGVLIRSNQWTLTPFAGIYPDTDREFNETQKYQDHAAIASITIRQ